MIDRMTECVYRIYSYIIGLVTLLSSPAPPPLLDGGPHKGKIMYGLEKAATGAFSAYSAAPKRFPTVWHENSQSGPTMRGVSAYSCLL